MHREAGLNVEWCLIVELLRSCSCSTGLRYSYTASAGAWKCSPLQVYFSLRLVMQRPRRRSRLDRRGLALILFRAPSVDVAASNVSEQRYTRTLAKTPDPSS